METQLGIGDPTGNVSPTRLVSVTAFAVAALASLTLGGCSSAPSVDSPIVTFLDTLIGWLAIASWIALAFTVVPLLPMAAFRRTRKGAVIGLSIVATVFFLAAWVFGLYFTIANWGWVGVVIGLLLAGVGVALTGLVSCMLAGSWEPFFIILALSALFIAAMWLAQRLSHKIEQDG